MPPKSPRVQRIADEFKEFLHELIDNVYSEALAQEISQDTVYKWRDVNSVLHFPAYGIVVSEYGDAIIEYLSDKRKEKFPLELNGSMDDEWADMAFLFSSARRKFLRGEEYDRQLAAMLKRKLGQLLAEWEAKSTDLPF